MRMSAEETRDGNNTRANGASGFTLDGRKSGRSIRRSKPKWQAGWDQDMRRFGARKCCDNDSEGGEQWQVIDFDSLRVVGFSDRKDAARLLADALEYLSLGIESAEMESALPHA